MLEQGATEVKKQGFSVNVESIIEDTLVHERQNVNAFGLGKMRDNFIAGKVNMSDISMKAMIENYKLTNHIDPEIRKMLSIVSVIEQEKYMDARVADRMVGVTKEYKINTPTSDTR